MNDEVVMVYSGKQFIFLIGACRNGQVDWTLIDGFSSGTYRSRTRYVAKYP
jgi:hypothetical protein